MTKYIKLLAVFAVVFLCACSAPDLPGDTLVLIVGDHRNSNSFTSNTLNQLERPMMNAFSSAENFNAEGQIFFIANDGRPEVQELITAQGKPISLKITAQNSRKRDSEIAAKVDSIMSLIKSGALRATEPETDLLGSLTVASRLLRNNPNGQNTIAILDSGIATSGYFSMLNTDIQEGSIEDIVSSLDKVGAIPDLKGIQILFLGLGNVASPQFLPENRIFEERLASLWAAIIAKGGGQIIDASGTAATTILYSASGGIPNSEEEYPLVTTVPFTDPMPESYVATTAQLGFFPDSIHFANPSEALTILTPFVQSVLLPKQNEGHQLIYIVGSEAEDSTKNPSDGSIAYGRANRIAEILCELGVQPGLLRVIGAGTTSFSWRNAQEFGNSGNYDENEAAKNRVVAIIPAYSSAYKELAASNLIG